MGGTLSNEKYSAKESRERFDAALRGARIAGHKPMSEIARKDTGKKKESPRDGWVETKITIGGDRGGKKKASPKRKGARK